MAMFIKPTFYITNDVERALWPGWENDLNYYIVTYRNPYSEWLKQSRKSIKSKVHKVEKRGLVTNIFLVDGKKGSTEELMKHKKVVTFIKSVTSKAEIPNIIVFKPTVEVEEWCKKMGWRLLNPSSRFAEQFEEKIAQTALFQKLKLRTPKTIVTTVGELKVIDDKAVLRQAQNDKDRIGLPAILQFNLGHTGEGTHFIRRVSDLQSFQKQFPKRPARVSEYIAGVPLTVNAVVGTKVYISAPSLQITGIPELTPLPFATVGNDWSWVSRNMEHGTWNMELRKIVIKIGNELKKKGYRGAFGVDLVLGDDGKLYVIETNVRQVNSCVYESELQGTGYRVQGTVGETTMVLYLKCLLRLDTGKEKLPETLEGAQVFVRAKNDGVWKRNIKPMSLRGSAKPASPDGGQGGQSLSDVPNMRLLRSQRLPRNDNSGYFMFSKLNKGDSVKKNVEVLRIQSDGSMIEKPMKLLREVQQIIPR